MDAVRYFHRRLRELGRPERSAGQKAYMKSELDFHGVTVPELRAVCLEYCKAGEAGTREALVVAVDALYATRWFDLRSAAGLVLERRASSLGPADLPWLIELVRRGGNWGHVDPLATKVVGPVAARDPRRPARLRAWAKDPDLWVRRTALLALLGELRRGQGDFALFAELAIPMLGEREFFIRKAIGWVLREVSKKRPELVREFLDAHGPRCSGVTLREATKYLPGGAAAASRRRRAAG